MRPASTCRALVGVRSTAGQEVLYEVHRWAALVLTIVTILHAYATTLGKPGTYRSMISGKVSREWASRYHPDWQPEATRERA